MSYGLSIRSYDYISPYHLMLPCLESQFRIAPCQPPSTPLLTSDFLLTDVYIVIYLRFPSFAQSGFMCTICTFLIMPAALVSFLRCSRAKREVDVPEGLQGDGLACITCAFYSGGPSPCSGLRSPFSVLHSYCRRSRPLGLSQNSTELPFFAPRNPLPYLAPPRHRRGRKPHQVCSRSMPRQIRGEKFTKTSNFSRVNRQSDKYRKRRKFVVVVNALHWLVIHVSSSMFSWIPPPKSSPPPKKKGEKNRVSSSSPGWRNHSAFSTSNGGEAAPRSSGPYRTRISFFCSKRCQVPSNPPNLHISLQSLRVA